MVNWTFSFLYTWYVFKSWYLFLISFLSSWNSNHLLLGYHSYVDLHYFCIVVNCLIDLIALDFVLVISLAYFLNLLKLNSDVSLWVLT